MPERDPISPQTFFRLLAIILLVQATVLLSTLGQTSLSRIDEGQIAEVAREMFLNGDWITPRIGGVPFAPYPPLQYWILAAFGAVFGFSEFVMRLPTALAAVLLVAVVAGLARRLSGSRVGLASAMVLATFPCMFLQGTVCRADVLATLLALAAFDRFHAWAEGGRKGRDLALVYTFAALGILAKGPITAAILVVGGLSWILLKRQWRMVLDLKLWIGVPGLMLLVLPWYVAVHRANGPGFLQENLLLENVHAFVDGYQQRRSPLFYTRVLWIAMAPWAFLLALVWKARGAVGLAFSLVWALGMLLLLSVSSAKRLSYIVYMAPAFAIATGTILAFLWSSAPRLLKNLMGSTAGLLLLSALVAMTMPQEAWKGASLRDVTPLLAPLSAAAVPALVGVLAACRRGAVPGSLAFASLFAAGALVHGVVVDPQTQYENEELAAFYRRSAAAMPPGAHLFLPPGGADGQCHFYANGPLAVRMGEPGYYIVTEAQKQSFEAEGRRFRILDWADGQRGRRRFLVEVYL